jgi:NTE family protein
VHISLQCELENCIPAFIEKLEKKQIPSEVTKALHLHRDWVENPAAYYLEILEYLYEITGYERISKPSAAELHLARCVPAGLSCLSRIQIDCLMKQASAITELQLKLYCPEY